MRWDNFLLIQSYTRALGVRRVAEAFCMAKAAVMSDMCIPSLSASVFYLCCGFGFVLIQSEILIHYSTNCADCSAREDLYACSWNSVEADEALHAAVYTCVWQDCGQSSLARDLRRKCSSFKWEEAIFFSSAVLYIKPEILLFENNFGMSFVWSIPCHSVIRV